MVSVVHGVEDLCLDWVEVVKLVHRLVLCRFEAGEWEGLEIEEVRVRWVELRENQVLESYGSNRLRPQPAVRNSPHIVLRRQGLEDGYREHKLLGSPS